MNRDPAVLVFEVGPRDGFQMERKFIPTDLKVEVINRLSRSGVRKIEAASFVSPKVISQMADASEVMQRIERVEGVRYIALVPNLKGAKRAIKARSDGLRVVLCASERYNQRNIGQSIEESLKEFSEIRLLGAREGATIEVILGLCFGCPLEGDIPPSQVLTLTERLVEIGFNQLTIADSVGIANPRSVSDLMRDLKTRFPNVHFGLHFHDTRGLGLANVVAGLRAGITEFDSSIGGLGGCPVVAGASGNIATEDLVNMLNEMGVETGVDPLKVIECSMMVQDFLGRDLPSHLLHAGTREQLYAKRKVPDEEPTCSSPTR